MRSFNHGPSLLLGLATIVFVTIACGGGGGGGSGDGGSEVTPATMSSDTLARSAAIALASDELTDLNQTFSPLTMDDGRRATPDLAAWVLHRVVGHTLLNQGNLEAMGSGSESGACSGDGSAALSATWDGPDDPVDCSEIANLNAGMSFNGCAEGDLFASGNVRLRMTGDACTPTAIAMEFSDLIVEDSTAGVAATISDLKMTYSNMIWAFGDIQRMTVTFNGDVNADLNDESYNAQFNNYRMTFATSDSGATTQVTVSGSMTGGCLDGWVTFKTMEPLVIPVRQNCPVSGRLRISGNGQGTVTFMDPGVRVTFEGQNTDYPSCDALPGC